MPRPRAIRNQPEVRSRNVQPASATIAGTGYSHIRNGRGRSGLVRPQQHHGEHLADELHEDPRRDQRVDHQAERQQAAEDRNQAQHEQRDVREMLGRVQPSEDLEEVAVPGGRVRNPRIAEEQREHRSERGPQDEEREHRRDPRPVEPLHERRDDELGFGMRVGGNELAPGHHADDREVDGEIEDRDRDDADQDRTRNHASGILDFVADVADVVVAEIVIDADSRRGAEAKQKADREVERAGRKVERARRVEVKRPARRSPLPSSAACPSQRLTVSVPIASMRR